MSTLTPQTVSLLEHLLASYRDAESTFRNAAAQDGSDRLRALMLSYAQMRSQLARELEAALSRSRRRSGSPSSNGNGHTHPADQAYDGAIVTLHDCAASDQECLVRYPAILRRELSQPLRQIVSRQYAAMRADHERMRELLPVELPSELSQSGSDF